MAHERHAPRLGVRVLRVQGGLPVVGMNPGWWGVLAVLLTAAIVVGPWFLVAAAMLALGLVVAG